LADALLNSGQAKEAVALLETYVREDPRSQGFFLLGQAYLQMQQYEKAREYFEAAIRKYPQYGDAYYRLSGVYSRLGQHDKAGQCLQKSRELKAKEREDHRVQKSRYDDFDAMCNRIAETYTSGARIYLTAGKSAETERLFRRAGDLASKSIECRQGLAWLCRRQGRTREGIEVLEQLAKIEPNQPSYWLEIGRLHARLNQFSAAEEAFRKASAMSPQDAAGPAALAGLLLDTNRNLPEALALARTAVQRRPTAAHYCILSGACERNGDLAGAVNAIAQAEKLEPSNPQYRHMHELLERGQKKQ
jgi:tetratricopeptide (TPR) repeat protein